MSLARPTKTQALMDAHAQRSLAVADRLRALTEQRLAEEMGRERERQAYEIKVRGVGGAVECWRWWMDGGGGASGMRWWARWRA